MKNYLAPLDNLATIGDLIMSPAQIALTCAALASIVTLQACGGGDSATNEPASVANRQIPLSKILTQADCTATKLGTSIPVDVIGEPVSSVTLAAPTWVPATATVPAYCRVTGSMAPVTSDAQAINFAVALPSSWNHRAQQQGGGGNNGSVVGVTENLDRGWVVYGSDSGHQGGNYQWAMSDEAAQNLGYMQMKKTHDAAWVVIERMYGSKPVYSYYIGSSQGGREALTVVQRYPADYDGVIATVPIVNFSSLTLSRALHRIQEKPLANWITPAKANAIAAEVMRQCDKLDGLADGIMNNYIGCRRQFDVKFNPNAWAAKRCPNNIDPNSTDTTVNACLTDGQISTMQFLQTPYRFATPLASGNMQYGMWVPNVTPSADGMINATRYKGQEGAPANAPVFTWQGGEIIVPQLWRDPNADPLTYVEGGALNARRELVSQWLDSMKADLQAFYQRGGRLIVVVGTGDSRASSGSQLDYYESVLSVMGRDRLDRFARLYVMPQGTHGLGGNNFGLNGDGATIPTAPIPNEFDRVAALTQWVEKDAAPGMSVEVTTGTRSLPLCSYPTFPLYRGGNLPTYVASSYECARN